jgi:hypothetical protein
VKNRVSLIHQLSEQRAVLDAIQEVMHPIVSFQMPDILHATGGKIVQDQDLISPGEQPLGEMRPDESCASSD